MYTLITINVSVPLSLILTSVCPLVLLDVKVSSLTHDPHVDANRILLTAGFFGLLVFFFFFLNIFWLVCCVYSNKLEAMS